MTYKQERNDAVIKLYLNNENLTMEEVGAQFGISRQRVEQILQHRGIQHRHSRKKRLTINLEPVMNVIRSYPVERFTEIHQYLPDPIPHPELLKNLKLADYFVVCKRLFKLRRRKRLIEELRKLADKIGSTPTKRDLDENGLYATKYQNEFGSLYNAQILAGLLPNTQGRH